MTFYVYILLSFLLTLHCIIFLVFHTIFKKKNIFWYFYKTSPLSLSHLRSLLLLPFSFTIYLPMARRHHPTPFPPLAPPPDFPAPPPASLDQILPLPPP